MVGRNEMLERDFIKRLKSFGIENLLISPDTVISIILFFAVGILTNWVVSEKTAHQFINAIIPVSAAFFTIILAGLAIISSFTDKNFIHAWVENELFADLVTIFQYNLYIPLAVTVVALFIEFVYYNSVMFIFLVAFFVYMVISLIDLIKFISTYALLRADFIEIEFQNKKNKL
jgi:hypothetical protein